VGLGFIFVELLFILNKVEKKSERKKEVSLKNISIFFYLYAAGTHLKAHAPLQTY
jgi:hypothetical protein